MIVEPHVHSDEDELSYVVAGTIWARVGEREFKALQGSPTAAAVLFRSSEASCSFCPVLHPVTRHAQQTAQIVGHASAASRTSSGMVLETLLCTPDARNGLRQKMVNSQKAAETSRHQYTHSPRVWSRATARSCTRTRLMCRRRPRSRSGGDGARFDPTPGSSQGSKSGGKIEQLGTTPGPTPDDGVMWRA